MSQPNIKVTLEYWGGWSNRDAHEYRIAKITGAVTVDVVRKGNPLSPLTKRVRVGDMISEQEADELAARVDVLTVPKADQ